MAIKVKELLKKHLINTKQEGISNFGISNMYVFRPHELKEVLKQHSEEQKENCAEDVCKDLTGKVTNKFYPEYIRGLCMKSKEPETEIVNK